MIPVNKNDELIVNIIDYGANGEGIAKIDGYTLFVMQGMKGEKVKVHILKALKNYAYAKIVEIIEKSDKRIENVDCVYYNKCGGCDLRHVDYKETLNIKQEKVQNLVNKELKIDFRVDNTLGCENYEYYRNKAIFPVSSDGYIGFYRQNTHDIIEINPKENLCKIHEKEAQEIADYIAKKVNENKNNKDILRNIMIRTGSKTNEVMCVLVQRNDKLLIDVEDLVNKFNNIKTIVININDKDTNVVLSNENKVIFGEGFIIGKLGEYNFKISPNSFYQVNSIQAEKMYNLAIDKINLSKDDILVDLYSGIGTIGIFASSKVKKVYGIEIVEDAIKDAKENAKINNINNIEFIQGDSGVEFSKLLKDIKPTALIVDPPRKGLDEDTINNILDLSPKKFAYISCNPATLVRDIKLLSEKYNVESITPVDMFPYTKHVESVAILKLK